MYDRLVSVTQLANDVTCLSMAWGRSIFMSLPTWPRGQKCPFNVPKKTLNFWSPVRDFERLPRPGPSPSRWPWHHVRFDVAWVWLNLPHSHQGQDSVVVTGKIFLSWFMFRNGRRMPITALLALGWMWGWGERNAWSTCSHVGLFLGYSNYGKVNRTDWFSCCWPEM